MLLAAPDGCFVFKLKSTLCGGGRGGRGVNASKQKQKQATLISCMATDNHAPRECVAALPPSVGTYRFHACSFLLGGRLRKE